VGGGKASDCGERQARPENSCGVTTNSEPGIKVVMRAEAGGANPHTEKKKCILDQPSRKKGNLRTPAERKKAAENSQQKAISFTIKKFPRTPTTVGIARKQGVVPLNLSEERGGKRERGVENVDD